MNVAEGAGRTTAPDRRRSYEIARGEAMECAAALDLLLVEIAALDFEVWQQARDLVIREVRLLSGLVRKCRLE